MMDERLRTAPAQDPRGSIRVVEQEKDKLRGSFCFPQDGNEELLQSFSLLQRNEDRMDMRMREDEILHRDEEMLQRIRAQEYQDAEKVPLARRGEQVGSDIGKGYGQNGRIMRREDDEKPVLTQEADLPVEHQKKKAHGTISAHGQGDYKNKRLKQTTNTENGSLNMPSKRVQEESFMSGQKIQETNSDISNMEEQWNSKRPRFPSLQEKGMRKAFNSSKSFGTHCKQGMKDTDVTSYAQKREDGINYRLGDMVWAKVKSHPWWPGQLYDPVLAASDVMDFKRNSCVLVAFFGDSTFGWFSESQLIPFQSNFLKKYNQTSEPSFVEAVDDALDVSYRREKSALMCRCSRKVNDNERKQGQLCERQLKETREAFEPSKLVAFIKRLASAPFSSSQNILLTIIAGAQAYAFRIFILCHQNFDYADVFGVLEDEDMDSFRMGASLQEMIDGYDLVNTHGVSGLMKGKKRSDKYLKFRKHATSSIVYGTGKITKKRVRQEAAMVAKLSNSKFELGTPLRNAILDSKSQLAQVSQSAQDIFEGCHANKGVQGYFKSTLQALATQGDGVNITESLYVEDLVEPKEALCSNQHNLSIKAHDKGQRTPWKLKASRQSQMNVTMNLQNTYEIEVQEVLRCPPRNKRKRKSVTKILQGKDANVSKTTKEEPAARVSENKMSARFPKQSVGHVQGSVENKVSPCYKEPLVRKRAVESFPVMTPTPEVPRQVSTVNANADGDDVSISHGKNLISVPARDCTNGDMLQDEITSFVEPINSVALNPTLNKPVGGLSLSANSNECKEKSVTSCISSTATSDKHLITNQNVSGMKKHVRKHCQENEECRWRIGKRTYKVTPSKRGKIKGPLDDVSAHDRSFGIMNDVNSETQEVDRQKKCMTGCHSNMGSLKLEMRNLEHGNEVNDANLYLGALNTAKFPDLAIAHKTRKEMGCQQSTDVLTTSRFLNVISEGSECEDKSSTIRSLRKAKAGKLSELPETGRKNFSLEENLTDSLKQKLVKRPKKVSSSLVSLQSVIDAENPYHGSQSLLNQFGQRVPSEVDRTSNDLSKKKNTPENRVITIRFPKGSTLPSEKQFQKTCERLGDLNPRTVKIDVTSCAAQVVYDNAESAETAWRMLKSSPFYEDARFSLKPTEVISRGLLMEKKEVLHELSIVFNEPSMNMSMEGRALLSPRSDDHVSSGKHMCNKAYKSCASTVDDGFLPAGKSVAEVVHKLEMKSSKGMDAIENFTTTGTAMKLGIENNGCRIDDRLYADDVIDISEQFMTLLCQVHALVGSAGFRL